MTLPRFEAQHFRSRDFSSEAFTRGYYDTCTFKDCHFNATKLSHSQFAECTFDSCDLSAARIDDTAFKTVTFRECKLVGLYFEHCHFFLLDLRFERCQLHLSSFQKVPLSETVLADCDLREVDFSAADLRRADFSGSTLERAVFYRSQLESADFRRARHYSINPAENRVRGARFHRHGLAGLLHHFELDLSG